MRTIKIPVGTKINHLTLLERRNAILSSGRQVVTGLFRCDCGNEKEIVLCNVTSHKQKACGCKAQPLKLPEGESAFNHVLREYKNGAAKQDRCFELATNEFRALTQGNCLYCGSAPSKTYSLRRGNGLFTYNGVDRVDNTKGYTVENCVSCCNTCNIMKGRLSQEKFTQQILTAARHLSSLAVPEHKP